MFRELAIRRYDHNSKFRTRRRCSSRTHSDEEQERDPALVQGEYAERDQRFDSDSFSPLYKPLPDRKQAEYDEAEDEQDDDVCGQGNSPGQPVLDLSDEV